MISTKYNSDFFNHRFSLFVIHIIALSVFAFQPASAENPWHEESKPLIDEVTQSSSGQNSWSGETDTLSKGAIDESKFPPFDEDTTLGTNLPVEPPEGVTTQYAAPPAAGNTFYYPESQSPRRVPVYPGSTQQSMPGYGNRQYPPYRPGYQSGYQRGFWPGNGNMGGVPFGNGSGNAFPFGGGSGWMPFSNSGFW